MAFWNKGASASVGERQPGTRLQTEELQIVDRHGNVRAILGTSEEDGSPHLIFVKGDALPLRLSLQASGPSLVLSSPRGTPSVKIGLAEQFPVVELCDDKGNPCLVAGVAPDGPVLTFCDDNGRVRLGLCNGKDGPRLNFHDASEVNRVQLHVDQTSSNPSFALFDGAGKERFFAALRGNDSIVCLNDRDSPRVIATVAGSGATLGLFSAKEQKAEVRLSADQEAELSVSNNAGYIVFKKP